MQIHQKSSKKVSSVNGKKTRLIRDLQIDKNDKIYQKSMDTTPKIDPPIFDQKIT